MWTFSHSHMCKIKCVHYICLFERFNYESFLYMKYMHKYFVLSLFAVLLITPLSLQSAHATTWYTGEGLKQGDYFRYNVCWIDWHNCTPIEIDFWVKNQTSDATGWNLEFLVTDGVIVRKGIVTIGVATPNPIRSDPFVSDYANIYNNTI